MHYMELGGAETALVGMLHAIDYTNYNVDLFLYSHQGEMMRFIPKEVNLLDEIEVYSMIEKPLVAALKAGYFRLVFARLKAKLQFDFYRIKKGIKESSAVFQYYGDAITPILPTLEFLGEYDLAISYLNPHNLVRDKVKAKKKICWIHSDYTRIDININMELPVWASFDHIISISPDVTKTFLQIFPSLRTKIVEMENILSPSVIKMREREFNVSGELSGNFIKLLSIGRFCVQKNFYSIPDICRRIKDKNIDIRWYIIGYGNDSQIRREIAESGMDDYVIILGKRSNPYPYIKACDIYVQPSLYEGKSITVREAQMLSKPVVVTDYPTAKSQIRNGVDGIIVPMDNEGCACGIIDFIQNYQLRRQIQDYLLEHNFGNENEINKLYELV